MNGNEQVGFVTIGNGGPFMQLNKFISAAGKYHLHIRKVFLNVLPHFQRYCQRNILFFHFRYSYSAGVMPTMTGIYHYCFYPVAVGGATAEINFWYQNQQYQPQYY